MSNDPLDNIMRQLTASGSVEPGQMESRQARMKQERQQAGASPRPQPGQREIPGQQQQPGQREIPGQQQQQGEAMKQDPATLEAPDRMDRVFEDALNEAILSIKIKKGRTDDPEQRRQLDSQAENIRQQIVQAGGEPIRADETVEEGIQKLRAGGGSKGFIASRVKRYAQQDEGSVDTTYQVGRAAGRRDEGTTYETRRARDIAAVEGDPEAAAYFDQQAQAERDAVADREADIMSTVQDALQQPTPTPGVAEPAGVDLDFDPEQAIPEAEPDYFAPEIARPDVEMEPDRFDEMMEEIGETREFEEAPEMHVHPDMVGELAQQYGIEPRSEEEIREHARAVVERQVTPKEQKIQREIDRFQRKEPTEFDRAQERIREQADHVSAEMQEEFAERGAYYSSVMANALTEVDQAAVEEISDIASEAANKVQSLRDEQRDLAEWAIVEEEVVRRELEAEDRQQRERLMQMHVEVAHMADQTALDTWYKESQLGLQQSQQMLQEVQLKIEEAERQGQHLAIAYMADSPVIQKHLRGMGITPEDLSAMSLEEQSALVRSAETAEGMELARQEHEINNMATLANIELQEQDMRMRAQQMNMQAALEGRRMDMQEAQFLAETEFAERELQAMPEDEGLRHHPELLTVGVDALSDAAETGDFALVDQYIGQAREQGYTTVANELESRKQEVQQTMTEEDDGLLEMVEMVWDSPAVGLRKPLYVEGGGVN